MLLSTALLLLLATAAGARNAPNVGRVRMAFPLFLPGAREAAYSRCSHRAGAALTCWSGHWRGRVSSVPSAEDNVSSYPAKVGSRCDAWTAANPTLRPPGRPLAPTKPLTAPPAHPARTTPKPRLPSPPPTCPVSIPTSGYP